MATEAMRRENFAWYLESLRRKMEREGKRPEEIRVALARAKNGKPRPLT